MRTIRILAALAIVVALSLATAAHAQTLSVLYNLGAKPGDPHDGGTTPNVVAQGRDGNLYTTSYWGGKTNQGTVYKVTPGGVLTVLYSFDGSHGASPWSGLILGTDGNFYGTTSAGGSAACACGTVFKMTPTGVLTTLYSFTGGSDGGAPYAPPIQGNDGNLYGTARTGGLGSGTIYRLTLSGTFTTLHEFNGTDGSTPATNLIQGTDGNFYGTASTGGTAACACGTVFKMTPFGKVTVLYNFDNTHGGTPVYASLAQASNGKFYGTTYQGGTNSVGVVYEMTFAGAVTILHNFETTDGAHPAVGFVQATDGNLYSITFSGGNAGEGTLFRINTSGGGFSVQHSFTSAEGNPASVLLQNTDGVFYGKTDLGGTAGDGVFYSFKRGLAPFVTFLPRQSLGKVGALIGIFGQGFTGTTAVSFNGMPATFQVWSPTYITATVPTGATTGSVIVTTPSATLTSGKKFRVTPQLTSFAPPTGPVGTVVTLNGLSLTQTTKVTFGGVAAISFTVNSDSKVTVTVPTGAVTGKIVITTSGGTAASVTSFAII